MISFPAPVPAAGHKAEKIAYCSPPLGKERVCQCCQLGVESQGTWQWRQAGLPGAQHLRGLPSRVPHCSACRLMRVSIPRTQTTGGSTTSPCGERIISLLVWDVLLLALRLPSYTNHSFLYVVIQQKQCQSPGVARHSREDKEADLSGTLEGFPLSMQCRQSQGVWEMQLDPGVTADLTCGQHCY